MIRLVCIDADGTLVGSSGGVPAAVWGAAARVRAAGVHLALCSGRPAFGLAREWASRLDADAWHIFQNGASVVHLASGRSLSAHLAPDTVALLIARARRTGWELELYTDDEYVVESESARARAHAALLGVPFAPRSLDSLDGPIVRAQWLLAIDRSDEVLREPHPGVELSPSTSPAMPDTHFVSLMPPGVDKGVAVQAMARDYGFAMEEVMFVGDGQNDAVAMRQVGFPVAMANAEPEVLAVARHTVGHVDEEGLVEALELALSTR